MVKPGVASVLFFVSLVVFSSGSVEAQDSPGNAASASAQRFPNVLQRLQWRPSEYFEPLSVRKAAAAIEKNSLEDLRKLHEAGVDWNHKGKDGVTLLLWAFFSNNLEAFTQLLEWGADSNAIITISKPLTISVDSQPIESGDSIVYITAAIRGKRQFLEAAIKNGGNAKFVSKKLGDSVFTVFCGRKGVFGEGRFRTEALLLEYGAQINHQNLDGITAVMSSFNVFDWPRVCFLIERGASVACYDSRDWQLVHLVAMTATLRDEEMMRDPTARAAWESSAEKKDFDRIVSLLAERGFSLEEAIMDVKRRNEEVEGVPYMKWRRMQREDRDACVEAPAKGVDGGKGQPGAGGEQ
jgi:hypothetical protein